MTREEERYLFVLGKKIEELYKRQYSSQNAFAKAVECDERTIRRVIRGEQNISLLLLRRIADTLNMSVTDLLGVEEVV